MGPGFDGCCGRLPAGLRRRAVGRAAGHRRGGRGAAQPERARQAGLPRQQQLQPQPGGGGGQARGLGPSGRARAGVHHGPLLGPLPTAGFRRAAPAQGLRARQPGPGGGATGGRPLGVGTRRGGAARVPLRPGPRGSKPSNLGDEDKEPRGPLTCTVRPVCQDGTCPESKEFWYMTTNASTITSAISFRTLGCISSGPGTGSLTAAVEAASGRKAKVIGKPSRFMFDCINEMEAGTPLDPARTLMIGDRLDTDILFGANCGLRTVLTLTGVSTLQQAHDNLASELPERRRMVPNFYVDSIKDFLPLLAS
ncbi:pyridoxal phosphate phosphatase isoform X3 [Narcine bancroftii]|uniref:pyridoxal phosphate phosphatase isoform X3 n=1 Tax=Narcine bancroftii TaxID=1343680 RepID=UPI00383148DC